MPRAAAGPRPGPQAAYVQWLDACANAGWPGANAGWPGAHAAEQVPVAGALGRVAAAQVRASWPVPHSDCAAMDGIAIAAGSVPALSDGPGPERLAASAFTWVDTGDPIPAGLDTVVERERVELGADGSALITGPVPRGLHVRARGEDFPAGQLLFRAGHRLRPVDLAAAAATGHAVLNVACRPVAALIPTGDEVRPAGSAVGPGGVTESNSLLLAARAGQEGATTLVGAVQPDQPDLIAAAVQDAAARADLVLVLAGSSAGRSDHTAEVLTRVGGLAVRGVAVRPGHPALLGYARAGRERAGRPHAIVPVIGVPGYPLAAAVIFELFAVPLIAALQGAPPPQRAAQWAQLACDWTSSPDVEDWVPVSLAPAPGPPDAGAAVLATPTGRGAGAISRLMRADAWWTIPVGQAKFVRGELIRVHPLPGAP
jgi:putative molybdopterin biosynthesis protein